MASILPHSISSAVPYQRHQPEKTFLYKLIQKNLLHFYHQVEREQEKELPYFVKKEFEEFLNCGLLSYGFLRLQCQSCKQERLLAFSCKRRGFCPSCGAKRMAEMASHLVDQVLPYKPLRQWVLSFPFPLRLLFAKDSQLIGLVLNLVLRAISSSLIKKAGFKKKSGAKTGSVTFIQQFGGSLKLNIHFHILYPEGVWTFNQRKVSFHPLSPPCQVELDNLVKTIAQRTVKLLEKRGLIVKDEGSEHKFLNLRTTQAIDSIHSSSITYRIALGKYRGRKALTLRTGPTLSKPKSFLAEYSGFSLHAGVFCSAHDRKKREHLCRYISRPSLMLKELVKLLEKRGLIVKDEGSEHKFLNLRTTQAIDSIHSSSITYRIALGKYRGRKALTLRTEPTLSKPKLFLVEYSGFSLHAGVFCSAHDRKKREHLCRYISRPSLSEARLSLNNKGQVVYKLKTPYRNGTTPIVLGPLDFLSRLSSLIPRPKIHLIRFHGVFAPNCKYRSLIVPQSALLEKTSSKEKKKQKKSYSMGWAKLIKRVFDIDIQTCLKCVGQIKVISAIHNQQVIKRILTQLGENPKIPELASHRGPPEEEESFATI